MQGLPEAREAYSASTSHKLDALAEGMATLLKDVPVIGSDLRDVKERVERLEDKVDIVGDAIREHIADKSLHK